MYGAEHFEAYRKAKSDCDDAKARAALDKFLRANEGLARRFAVYYARRKTHLELDELFNASMHGMADAARYFDPAKAKFSTYAKHWMFRRVQMVDYAVTDYVHRPQQVHANRVEDYRDRVDMAIIKTPEDWQLRARSLNATSSARAQDDKRPALEEHEFLSEEQDEEVVDRSRLRTYLRTVLGDEDYAALDGFRRSGEHVTRYIRRAGLSMLQFRQIQETAFCHAQAFQA